MPYDQDEVVQSGRFQMEVVSSSHERLDLRSLAMHRLIADKIRAEPKLFEIASQNIERWSRTPGRNGALLAAWSKLLMQGIPATLAMATEDSERARELRQSTPFAGVLSPQERWSFLKKWNATNLNT
jgi:hypothetical protein